MHTTQTVRCSNCGSEAERRYFTSDEATHSSCPSNQVIQTECPVCDYLMVMCSLSGSVIEAYAPGTPVLTNSRDSNPLNPISVFRMLDSLVMDQS
ncbi:MAG: hypothetical protein AB4426_14675 [Xenococcaceae cyanobacterium]